MIELTLGMGLREPDPPPSTRSARPTAARRGGTAKQGAGGHLERCPPAALIVGGCPANRTGSNAGGCSPRLSRPRGQFVAPICDKLAFVAPGALSLSHLSPQRTRRSGRFFGVCRTLSRVCRVPVATSRRRITAAQGGCDKLVAAVCRGFWGGQCLLAHFCRREDGVVQQTQPGVCRLSH